MKKTFFPNSVLYRSALILSTAILFASGVWAQSTDAVVSGNILDHTGANVPAAIITAFNVNTGVKTAAVSNASGVYLFAVLPPGQYRFGAEKQGFKRLELNETTIRVGDHLQQNLTLQVGGISSSPCSRPASTTLKRR